MRFIVIDIAASSGGAMTILKGFYNYIKANSEHEWIFLLSDNYIEETDNIKVWVYAKQKQSRFRRLLFDFFTGRNVIRKSGADAIVNFQNTRICGSKVPQIIYQDQPIPFQKAKSFSFFKKDERDMAVYQYLIGAMVKAATKKSQSVVVQTEWMRNAVIKQCRVPEENVYLIPPAIDLPEIFYRESETAQYDQRNFFYPASDAVYKNHECIYKACKLLEEENISIKMSVTIKGSQSSNIEFLGAIPYEDVIRKYKASTLVFPSYIETYGLPLAEARRLNCIVLAADTEFSRELLNNYNNAYFFNYEKPDELAALMKKVALGNIKREHNAIVFNEDGLFDGWEKFHEICVITAQNQFTIKK